MDQLPTMSIIICFYNEHIVTLLRSIKTVLDRTPSHLLTEIILVDDNSDLDDLKGTLEQEIKALNTNKIRIIRNEKREGLIRSRVFGARQSNGDVLLFLDSHVEANVGYAEPLLNRIRDNRRVLAIPVIDIINPDTFAYTPSPLVRGGFNWGLHFKWDNLPKGSLEKDRDFLGPFRSPTMAGGLFAIDRTYFTELGEYDLGYVFEFIENEKLIELICVLKSINFNCSMDIWGGENLEISFRAWQCGGSLEILPCSRIGHVFRKRRPYNGGADGIDTMIRNSLRMAHVWMDDYVVCVVFQKYTKTVQDFLVKIKSHSTTNDFGFIPGLFLATTKFSSQCRLWRC